MLLEKISALLAVQWRYEDEPLELDASEQVAASPAAKVAMLQQWTPPKHPLLDELLGYVQIGHKKGVIKVLSALEQQAIVDGEVIASLQQLVLSMRFDSIEALLTGEEKS
jgi:hypothetical protein